MTKTRALVLSLFALVAISGCKKKKEDETKTAAAATVEPAGSAATPTPDPATATPPAEPAAATTGVAAIAIPQAKSTMENVLTGGQPTPEHLAQFKEQGVKVVVNLRSAAEEKDFADEAKTLEAAGIKYVHIPIDGKTGEGISEDNAKKLAELMKDESKPMVIHCATGQRVGALLAMKAKTVDGKTPEEALKIGQDNGLTKPELVAITGEKLGIKAAAPAADAPK